jgi:hypothetical protein
MTTVISKPLPCPFCGHEADAGRVGLTDRFAVACGDPEGCVVEAQATAGSREEAIRLWNTRPIFNQRRAA